MSKYYGEHYYSFKDDEGNGPKARLKRMIKNGRNRYAIFRRGLIGKKLYQKFPNEGLYCLGELPVQRTWKIVDIGCGSGVHLRDLKHLGFQNVMGIDPFIPEDIYFQGEILVKKADIASLDERFDLVMLHHSFEHLEDQGKTLDALAKLLKENGVLMLRVPLASSEAFETYRENWVQLDAPRHFYLHSLKSMQYLAKEAGLSLFHTFFDSGAFQFWGSEQYKKGIGLFSSESLMVNSEAEEAKNLDRYQRRAFELNATQRGDQACFYLKRIS
jgi:SAM-dependent methyltransferase